MRLAYIIITVVGIFVCAAFMASSACSSRDALDAYNTLYDLSDEHQALLDQALETPRDELPPLIEKLEGMEQRVTDTNLPSCGEEAKSALIEMINQTAIGHAHYYLTLEQDEESIQKYEQAVERFEQAMNELVNIIESD